MSELSGAAKNRLSTLHELATLLLETGNARSFFPQNQAIINTAIPADFIRLFDDLVKAGHSFKALKSLSNKLLNLFHNTLKNYPGIPTPAGSFLEILARDNEQMELILKEIRPYYRAFLEQPSSPVATGELRLAVKKLEPFARHYAIKENLLFPILERFWPDYRCLQIMWSFHDEIRGNLHFILQELEGGLTDLGVFNRRFGDLFFQMMAIKFREEKILFPVMMATVPLEAFDDIQADACAMGIPFILARATPKEESSTKTTSGRINLGTGSLTPDQVAMIFNHLPVDITYVDENERVQFFSNPAKRIFPRTAAIIGREVRNCHPPESMHVVEQIIQAFKSGQKDEASFWINLKGETILIRYFAVRDAKNAYRGIIEVSQEVSYIQHLEGEKKLLDW